jgi:hypothetical protein
MDPASQNSVLNLEGLVECAVIGSASMLLLALDAFFASHGKGNDDGELIVRSLLVLPYHSNQEWRGHL